MKQELIVMPAAYATISDEELCYLDGGDDTEAVSGNVLLNGISTVVSFIGGACAYVVNFTVSAVRSFVDTCVTDFTNPNFQFALAVSAALVAASTLIKLEREAGRM